MLVVDDPVNDPRFEKHHVVVNDPKVRVYAGAPFQDSLGNVIGTVCVLDVKKRNLSKKQLHALQILAGRAVSHMEDKKTIETQKNTIADNIEKLKRITTHAPGALFQLELTKEGKMSFPFMSEGISKIHSALSSELLISKPSAVFKYIEEEDIEKVQLAVQQSYAQVKPLDIEFRVKHELEGATETLERWHWAYAYPYKGENGTIIWYGTFQDVTDQKEQVALLEKMIYDISHVVRRPASSILGLVSLIESSYKNGKSIDGIMEMLKDAGLELDGYLHQLSDIYANKRLEFKA